MKQKPTWDISTNPKNAKIGEVVDLIFTSKIEKDWYMYSNDFSDKVGPVVAFIDFKKDASYELVGKTKPVGSHKKYDDVFEGEVSTFVGKAEFHQKVKILKANPKIVAELEFQECSQITGQCVLFNDELKFAVNVTGGKTIEETKTPETVEPTPASTVETTSPDTTTADSSHTPTQTLADSDPCDYKNMQVPSDQYIKENGEKGDLDGSGESLWGFMIYAFLFGLGAIMTPCVFPMIP
ncbi:MAG: protein-disulfide reductase DsbD domain-containing protein, partial [Bacteroidia bacterium]